MARAEAGEEGAVGGHAEPAPADSSGANEAGGEDEAEEDLAEQVVAKHRRDRRLRRGWLGLLPRRVHGDHADEGSAAALWRGHVSSAVC